MRQDPTAEEYFALANPAQVLVQIQGVDHLDSRLFFVHDVLGQHVGGEDFVPLTEFLERDAVGEALLFI